MRIRPPVLGDELIIIGGLDQARGPAGIGIGAGRLAFIGDTVAIAVGKEIGMDI